MRHLAWLWICLSAFSCHVMAETTPAQNAENKMTIEDAAAKKNTVAGDLDEEITNPKLRADSGSKSKWSMSSQFSYTGGALASPFAADRPNLTGLPENQVESSIGGSLKTRYRTSKNSSYIVGVGVGIQTPFQGRINSDEKQINIGDPLLGYDYTFQKWGLQHSMDLTSSIATSNESLHVDEIASGAIAYSFMKPFQSGFHVGINSTAYYNAYSSNPGANKSFALSGGNRIDSRTSWAATISPVVEYMFNDTVSFRALFAYFRWRHLYGDEHNWSLIRIQEYQSVGFGISLTRDVYLYPNVQFLPLNARSDYTNFGISTSINVF